MSIRSVIELLELKAAQALCRPGEHVRTESLTTFLRRAADEAARPEPQAAAAEAVQDGQEVARS